MNIDKELDKKSSSDFIIQIISFGVNILILVVASILRKYDIEINTPEIIAAILGNSSQSIIHSNSRGSIKKALVQRADLIKNEDSSKKEEIQKELRNLQKKLSELT